MTDTPTLQRNSQLRKVPDTVVVLRHDSAELGDELFEKFASLSEKVALMGAREEALEKRIEALEAKESKLESEERQLEEVQEQSVKLQGLLEELGRGNSRDKSLPRYTEFEQEYQDRISVQQRKAAGVTVDFLEREAQEVYHFKQSTWDIAIFIGTNTMGLGGSLLTSVLLVMSVLMQVVFVGIVWYNFADASVDQDTIKAARWWRMVHAHDRQYMSMVGYSLVARVCAHDKSLLIASTQERLYEDITRYIKPDAKGLEAMFVGECLCVVALVCWFLMVSKEVHRSLDLFRGLLFLGRGRDKLEPVERPGHATLYRIASISHLRILVSAIVVGYRLAVAGVLTYCGTFFLVYTIDITELILNSVSLDIILNIDDLLFDAMTTATARHLVLRLEPLRMPRWPHCKGIDMKALGMALTIPGAVIVIYFIMISPMVDDLNEVAQALCGGSQNFVYGENAVRMRLFLPTTPCKQMCYPGHGNSPQSKATREALRQADSARRNFSEYAIWLPSRQIFGIHMAYTFDQTVSSMAAGICVDMLKGPYLHYMRHILQNTSISDCSDVKPWCSSPSFLPDWGPDSGKGLYARMLCPSTCQCDNPGGAIALLSGCPLACVRSDNPTYAQNLRITDPRCPQRSWQNLTNSTDWMAWTQQIWDLSMHSTDQTLAWYAGNMSKSGCNGLRQQPPTDCIWTSAASGAIKGISFWCPQECRCWDLKYAQPSCPTPCMPGPMLGPSGPPSGP